MHLKVSFLTCTLLLGWSLSTSVKAENTIKNYAFVINWSDEITDAKMCKLAIANFNWYCDWFWSEERVNSKLFYGFKYYWFDFNRDNQLDLYFWEHAHSNRVCGNGRCSSWVILQEKPTLNAQHFKVIDFPPVTRDVHPHLYWPNIGKLGSISIPDSTAYDVESNLEDHKFDIDVFLKEENFKNVTVRNGELIIK